MIVNKFTVFSNEKASTMSAPSVQNMKLPDGRLYSGECKAGMPSGVGMAVYQSGNGYTGTWKEGREWGTGKVREDGITYEGDMSGGDGKSSATIIDDLDTVYEGSTFNFTPHGTGVMRWQNCTSYTGSWVHGSMEGKGVSKICTRMVHRGGYLNGKRHCAGRVVESNGTLYTGGWHKNSKQGKGRELALDGSVFKGRWMNDCKHGRASTKKTDGTVVASSWRHGHQL